MGNICVIGPRSSGKTTYLATLAYWPDRTRSGRQAAKFTIQPLNEDAKNLAAKAENIICQGESLEPTYVQVGGLDALPYYSFKIEINHWFGKPDEMTLAVRDYPGEIFDELESGSSNYLHQEFIEECLRADVSGCLILLTDWKKGIDRFYSRVLDKFTELMDRYDRGRDLRLAIAVSKCERGELWPGRLDPEVDLFDVHFPQTKQTLKSKINRDNLGFYAISTFGVLGSKDPRPNRVYEIDKKGIKSVLREPPSWRPYGIISPLYWLSKGKRMSYDA